MDKETNRLPSQMPWGMQATTEIAKELGFIQRMRAMGLCWWTDARFLILIAISMVSANRRKILFLSLTGLGLLPCLMQVDLALLSSLRYEPESIENARICMMARWLSYWGDFVGLNLFVFGTLACFSFMRRSPFFRRLTIAALLGTVFTAGVANAVRVTTGRARPGSHLAPGFYGPTLSARKQSFPSAHTATSFGACVPLAVALPPVGVPLLMVSGGVAWSRMQNNSHHPSDVAASIMLSLFFGIPLGLAVRRMKRDSATAF